MGSYQDYFKQSLFGSASMCLNRFTPEYRLKPWIKRTGTTADFSSAEKELTSLPVVRYG
jgi:hypothetical protein